MRRLIFTLCFTLLCTGAARAQDATLSGSIADSTGAVVSQASVQLLNRDTGVTLNAESNSAGVYTFPFVKPGVYDITIQKAGFKTLKQVGATLNVAQNARIDFALEIGAETQSVEVKASSLEINTTDATVSTVVDRQFVENLPLNGRSFQGLLYMTPGVNLNAGGSATGADGTAGQFVVNGQRASDNYWMVDGVSGNIGMIAATPGAGASGSIGATNSLGGTSALVSVDALQEFRIQTSTYAPEYGRTVGGQISIDTRSGTNQFHGLLFDYLRNTDLDASDWFADHYGLPKAAEIQNDFGGVFGGPIIKDKTFLFFSYEGLRVLQPRTDSSETVPDLAARAAAVPAMQPFLNMYPKPLPGTVDTTPGSGVDPYYATFSLPSHADAYSLRVDHQLANNLRLFARYNQSPSGDTARGDGIADNDTIVSDYMTKTATAGATWIASSHVVDDLRLNYSVSGGKVNTVADSFGGGTPMPTFTFPSPFSYANAIIYIYAVSNPGLFEFQGLDGKNYQRQWNIVDSVSVQKGAHSLKFGVDYRRLTPNYGQATYESIPIFYDMPDYEAGNANEFIISYYAGGRFLLQNLGAYAQDTWRVNSRLNLTYGLRWDVDFAPQTIEGLPLPGVSGFSDSSTSNLALAPGTKPYSTHFGNIGPRIGGAYRLFTTPGRELVLRGGFGVFFGLDDSELLNAYAIDEPVYPYGTDAFYVNQPFPTSATTPAAQLPALTPPTATNGQTLFAIDPNINQPYALEWNVAVQQALGNDQNFSLSYIGASNKRQASAETVTDPNPNYAEAYLVGDTGTLSYQALQAEFQRRLSHGLQALVSYTWSHTIDTGSYGGYSNGTLADINANRGDADYDLRNVFSGALTYQPPSLKNNRLLRAITSDWSTDDIVQLRSGAPIDVNDANFTALEVTRASTVIRPDVVPGQPRYLTGSQYPGNKALNPAAFTNPPVDPTTMLPTRQGDLGRNASRALGLEQWDFAARRDFPIHENLKLQFRAELFNILNHPNFGPFNNSFLTGNTLFGQSTSQLNQYLGSAEASGAQGALYSPGGPRSGQLALKLVF
jgi:Carboxypeptidase regulatory-like domain/TonB dependent receptor